MSNTKDIILDAARSEFLEKGFDATRMRGIASRAEINKGLLHYYFKSKDALILEVFQKTFQNFFGHLDEIMHQQQDAIQLMVNFVDIYFGFLLENPDVPRFIVSEMSRNPKEHLRRMKQAKLKPPFAEMTAILIKAKTDKKINAAVDPQHFFTNLLSMVLFPLISDPMIRFLNGMSEKEYKAFLLEHKEHVKHTVMTTLKP